MKYSVFAIALILAGCEPKYKFCPKPDITAYEVAQIMTMQNDALKIAADPELKRHVCELK